MKKTREAAGGTLPHMVVSPRQRASKVTARHMPRTPRETQTRSQKKAKVKPVLGGSLDSIGLPAIQPIIIWIK